MSPSERRDPAASSSRAATAMQAYAVRLTSPAGSQVSSARAKSSASNGRRSSSCSPIPISLTGMPELVGDRQRDAALGGPVELGQDDAVDVDRLPEQLRLAQAVLARRGVDGHQRLVRRVGHLLGDHAPDLGQLLHQVVLRVQAPGGVDDHHVGAALAAAGDRVEGDRARIGALRALDERRRPRARPTARAARPRRRGTCPPRRSRPSARAPCAGARRACRSWSSCRCR